MQGGQNGGISPLVLCGFAVASSGGPLAIATLYALSSAGLPPGALPRAMVLGIVIFAAPLWIWLSYSRRLATAGGLYAFARAAAGEPFAWWQGVVWSFSYLLYLPYTVTYIVYYLLPAFTHLSARADIVLQLGLPVLISVLVASGRRVWLGLLLISSVLQIGAVAVFGLLALLHPVAAYPTASAPTGPALPLAGGVQMASLFVCISLVLYLGDEAAGGAPALRRALFGAFAAVAATSLFAAAVLAARATPAVAASSFPGVTLARLDGGVGAAAAVGLLTLLSVAGLIVSEYVALSRLWREMFGYDTRRSILAIGAWFVATDALGLIHPHRFYNVSIIPSLVALFVSQVMVFAVYPLFAKREGALRVVPVLLTAVALAWALFGLYSALVTPAS